MTLGIADLLRDGPGGAADLAKATSWHDDSLDLRMLVMSGGRERTPKEFRDLLVAADLKLGGIYPTDAPQSIIESMPTQMAHAIAKSKATGEIPNFH